MYRQIKMDSDSSDFQRIVWRFSPDQPMMDYRFTTVTYGTAAAAFLAIRSLHQLAIDEKINFPIESKIVLNDFYVDDLMTGCDDIETALHIKTGLNKLLEKGGFELRKWNSNCIDIIHNTIIWNFLF